MAEFRQRVREDGTYGVDLVGEIDLAVTSTFIETVRECLAGTDAVALDFDAVTFIDSSGLGALVLLRKEADEAHKKLFVANLSPATTRLLRVTGLEGTFDTLPGSQ